MFASIILGKEPMQQLHANNMETTIWFLKHESITPVSHGFQCIILNISKKDGESLGSQLKHAPQFFRAQRIYLFQLI